MIDVEKLIREGKSEEDILKLLKGDIETANLKIDKEKEAEKIEALKKEQLKDAIAQAEAALQAVYDLSNGNINVSIVDGKASVYARRKSNSVAFIDEDGACIYKNKGNRNYSSILDDILKFWE